MMTVFWWFLLCWPRWKKTDDGESYFKVNNSDCDDGNCGCDDYSYDDGGAIA